jgi:hypothetical protein
LAACTPYAYAKLRQSPIAPRISRVRMVPPWKPQFDVFC